MKKMIIGAMLFATCASAQAAEYQKGDWVLAQWKGGSYWFPGTVESTEGKMVTIVYDDGSPETRPVNQVRPYNWRVGSKIECVWAKDGEWYGAVITQMNADGESLGIRYEDGTVERTKTKKCRAE